VVGKNLVEDKLHTVLGVEHKLVLPQGPGLPLVPQLLGVSAAPDSRWDLQLLQEEAFQRSCCCQAPEVSATLTPASPHCSSKRLAHIHKSAKAGFSL